MLILIISIFSTVYAHSSHDIIMGYTCVQMVWYFAAIRFFFTLVVSYQDLELSEDIISGNMVVKLNKPITVMRWHFAKAVAQKIFSVFLELLPVCLIYAIIIFPDFFNLLAFIKYILVTVLAFVLFFLASFLIGITAFILKSTSALRIINIIFLQFAAGVFLPFEFFPKTVQAVFNALPFKYLCYIPNRFFLNMPETRDWLFFIHTITAQAAFIVFLYLACRLYWYAMVKKFTAVGC
jgi:ABC-2 type transport system permease protein